MRSRIDNYWIFYTEDTNLQRTYFAAQRCKAPCRTNNWKKLGQYAHNNEGVYRWGVTLESEYMKHILNYQKPENTFGDIKI